METKTYSTGNLPLDTITIEKRGVVWRASYLFGYGIRDLHGYGTEPQQAIESLWLEEAIDNPDDAIGFTDEASDQEPRPIPENLQRWLDDGGAKGIG